MASLGFNADGSSEAEGILN